jgi:hypothetical protein
LDHAHSVFDICGSAKILKVNLKKPQLMVVYYIPATNISFLEKFKQSLYSLIDLNLDISNLGGL